MAQHQVAHILYRNHHSLASRKTTHLAVAEKTLYFFIHAANGLDIPKLINGTRHRNVLPKRNSGEGG